ncbi:IDEAL domain-containing protein [Priestia megaterium]|uniref:IDEAL domain-containing protein n=1 Tax=Priestia megaterium TaxID=1404 RepID=UPI0025B127EE|nr:IDEAL domain-containing protein [Priestia megaterium]MDN3233365.1 IDEAL domain-containing protein [Priestia megaterium]
MENNVSNEVNRVETNISDEILAELFLEQMLCEYKKIQILRKIDQSLQNRDKAAFLRFTEELKSVS